MRLGPIVAVVVLAAGAVVLARAAVRLTDLVGLVAFAAASAWLVTPLQRRLSQRVGSAAATVALVLGVLGVALVAGALVLADLVRASDELVRRLAALDEAGGNSWMDRLRRGVRLGEGASSWVSSLPGAVVADDPGRPAIGRRVIDLIVVAVLMGFFLAEGASLVARSVGAWPRHQRDQVWSMLRDVDTRAGGYLRRSAAGMAAGASMTAAVGWVVGAPYPAAIGAWAGFWMSVPTVGWIVAVLPSIGFALDADPADAWRPLAVVASGVALSFALRSWRAACRRVLRPSSAVVSVCVALGVAASGGALALLLAIGAVVAVAVVSSPHRVTLPTPEVDRRTIVVGPLALPGGATGVAWGAAVVLVTVVTMTALARASSGVVWIATALMIAVAAERPVSWLVRRVHVPRRAAAAVFLLGTALVFAALLGTLVAEGPESASRALDQLPAVVEDLERAPLVGDWLAERDAAATVQAQLEQLPTRLASGDGASSWFPTLGAQLTGMLWVLLLVTAFVLDGPRLAPAVERSVPVRWRRQYHRLSVVGFRALAGYAAGAVLVSAMNGAVVFVLALVLQLGLAPVLALWAFVWDFVPQVGGFVGGGPLLLFALVAGSTEFVVATVVYLVWQLIESNVIFPAIISDAVDIPGWAAMVAALAGAVVAGIVGAIVLTPLVGVARLVVAERRRPDFPGRVEGGANTARVIP